MQCLSIFTFALALACPFAHGADLDSALGFGAVQGVALDAAGHPLAMVKISIHNLGDGTERTVVSDSEGAFSSDRLPPELTA